MKLSFHQKLLILSTLFLLFSFQMYRSPLVNLDSPSRITIDSPKRGFVHYDTFNYFEDTKAFLGEGPGSGLIYRQSRLLYPLLSTIPYMILGNINSMLVVPFLSAIVSIHFIDLIFKKVGFSKEDRLLSVLFVLSSHIFSYYSYTALPKTITIAVGLWFVKEWIYGASNNRLAVLGIISILTSPEATIFPMSCFAISYLQDRNFFHRYKTMLPFFLILFPFALVFFECAVLMSQGQELISVLISSFLKVVYFPIGLYYALGPLSLFTLTGIVGEIKNSKRSELSEILLFSLILATALILFWPGTYSSRTGAISVWIIAIPGAVYFSMAFMRGLKRELKLALSASFFILAQPHSHSSELINATIRLFRVIFNI